MNYASIAQIATLVTDGGAESLPALNALKAVLPQVILA